MITFTHARELAVEKARSDLFRYFPESTDNLFEDYIFENDQFWIFFRNRKIEIPDFPDGNIRNAGAWLITKSGWALTIRDNLENKVEFEHQVQGLTGHVADQDRRRAKQ